MTLKSPATSRLQNIGEAQRLQGNILEENLVVHNENIIAFLLLHFWKNWEG